MLLAEGMTHEQLNDEEAVARKIIEAAVKFAIDSPAPDLDSLYEGTFAN
jgi:TPP-dependent pyruvate/acetoin dehydrogenase alpha subunit